MYERTGHIKELDKALYLDYWVIWVAGVCLDETSVSRVRVLRGMPRRAFICSMPEKHIT